MHDISACSLRAIERWDNIARITLSVSPAPSHLDALFPDRLSLTLAPNGAATALLRETALEHNLAYLSSAPSLQILRGLTFLRLSGVCMCASEEGTRRVCAELSRAGLAVYTLSLSDLGLALAISSHDADRAIALIEDILPASPL